VAAARLRASLVACPAWRAALRLPHALAHSPLPPPPTHTSTTCNTRATQHTAPQPTHNHTHAQAAAVDTIERGLMQEAQKFFVLTQTDNLWKEHLQARMLCRAGGCMVGSGCARVRQRQRHTHPPTSQHPSSPTHTHTHT
jgi:hypothetical protein